MRTAVIGCALVVLTTSACGRIHFDPLGGDDAATDVSDAADGVSCWAAWQSHTIVVDPPARIPELVNTVEQGNPFLARDNRTLYFHRTVGAQRDLFVAVRAERGQPFGTPALVTELSELATSEGRLSLSADGLIAAFAAQRSGTFDVWIASRSAPAGTFDAPTSALTTAITSGDDENDPELSDDGLRLYYAQGLPGTAQALHTATRASTSVAFGTNVPVAGIDPALDVADPSLSPDELVMVFTVEGATEQINDLYYATRAQPGDPFGPPEPIAMVNAPDPADESDASLSADGCELVFKSDRTGIGEIYAARVR